jgi:hypothetical protein
VFFFLSAVTPHTKKRKSEAPQTSPSDAEIHAPAEPSFPLPLEPEEPVTVIPGALTVNGEVKAKAFIQYSDIRLKTNIDEIVDAVNVIRKLEGKTYTWRKDVTEQSPGRRVIGMIAQEVRKVLPEVVYEDENGLLSVSYSEIIPILIEAFKEQFQRYNLDREAVQSQLDALENKLEGINQERDANKLRLEKNFLPITKPEYTFFGHLKRKNLWRAGVLFTFIFGLCLSLTGALLIGETLNSSWQLTTKGLEDPSPFFLFVLNFFLSLFC